MKRLLMGFAACTLMMASCSQNEVFENVSEGQGQLSFSTGLGKQAVTRAAELNNTALQGVTETNGIVLNAYQNVTSKWSRWYEDEVVYKNSQWGLRKSIRFRNENATKYISYFSTVSGALTSPTHFNDTDMFTADKFPKFTYTVAGNSATQEDLIAGITEVDANKTNITLGMRHILSQVNFGTVGYEGANISIRNINIVNVGSSADFTYRAKNEYPIGDWSTPAEKNTNYVYYNWGGNNPDNMNLQPLVPASATKGDKYIFGDGGNWGPGKGSGILYPVGTNGKWEEYNTTTPQTGLKNSLMLMPQDLGGAKVTFEYIIQDVSNAYVAGNDSDWAKGEFSLNFSTGTSSGTHYDGAWEQNYRYVYLIDFTDFLDGIALTFKVNVEAYPWENYNKDTDDDGIVNIMAAGQPSTANMNTITGGNTWYIASQSETNPTTFDPAKWAQVMRNETWDLSTYDFANIDADGSFILDFTNVIFNTQTNPTTQIDLTLPDGYTATKDGEITIDPNTPPRYTVKMNPNKTSGKITILNTKYCNKDATLKTKIAAITTDAQIWYYKGTGTVNLTIMQPDVVDDVSTITVKFTSLVTPTVGATTNGLWTWNSATRTATWRKVVNLTTAETSFKTAGAGTIIYSNDATADLSTKFATEPTNLVKDALVTIVFKTAAARIMPTATYGTWTYYAAKNTAIYKRNDVLS